MTELFLRLLGHDPTDAGKISGASVDFHSGIPLPVIITAFAVLACIAFWLYAKSPRDVKPGRRVTMAVLRTILFGALLALLLRPVLTLDLDEVERRTLPVLVDASVSMSIADARESDEDMKRASTALGSTASGSELTRMKIATAALANKEIAVLSSLEPDLDLAYYRFDKELAELPADALSSLEPKGEETALGNSLRGLLNRRRGESLAGVFIVTDGVNTLGENPRDAAEALRDAGIPLYIYGVGSTESRDVAIEGVEVADAALVEDAVPVTVRVRSRGMEGKTAKVIVALEGVPAAEQSVTFQEDGVAEVSLAFLPKQSGDFNITATVVTDEEEVLADNNAWSRQLRVLDSRIRVLMVEQSPRWEFKYIQAMLLREKRVETDCLVFEADREVTRVPGSPFIEQFPSRREDLFKYDLILFGDVDPKSLTQPQMENVAAFVSEAGGSLVVISGKRFTPQAYRHTVIERLLPVELQGASIGSRAVLATKPIQLSLTSFGEASSMLQLEETRDASLARWKKLPPIYWTASIARAKPAAEVLLVDPDPARAVNGDPKPIVALHRYGSGEVLFVGTDNTWRWRKNIGDLYHTLFWGQVVQRMAGGRLLAGSRNTRLTADKRTYRSGERVSVFAKLQTENFEPLREDMVKATLEDADGQRREIVMRAVPEKPGYYRTEFTAPEDAGRYRLTIADRPASPVDISVQDSASELIEPAMNEGLLKELAAITGGGFFREENLAMLPASITNRTATLTTQREIELWATPLIFILLVLLVATEWVIRKLSELK